MQFKQKVISWCLRFWPLLLLLLAFLAINSDIFFAGRTLLPIAPSYTVLPYAPAGYHGPTSQGFTSLDPAGTLNVSYAFDAFTQTAVQAGHLPLWNPFQGLGQPFLSNGISSVLSPFTWVASLTSPAYWDWVYVLPWFFAACGLYAYLRLWKVDRGASLLGSFTLLASGLIQFYAMLREYGGVIAWVPFLLYSIERTLREPAWRLRHAMLAVGIFGLISAGQPEVYSVAVISIFLYTIIRLISFRPQLRKLILAFLPGVVGGCLLALPALLAFSQYAFEAFSLHDPSLNVGLEHLPFKTILSYFFPFLYGRSDLSILEAGWFPLLGLFLAACALSKRHTSAAVWLALSAFLLMAAKIWGVPVINLVGHLPLLDRIQFPKYASFVLTLSLAILTGFGAQRLVQLSATDLRTKLLLWLGGIGAVWVVSVLLVWDKINFQHLLSTEAGLYGVLGGAWAALLPLGMWWVSQHNPKEKNLLYVLAGAGVGLQSIAYALSGYQLSTYRILSLVCLITFAALVILFSTPKRLTMSAALGVTLLTLTTIPIATAIRAEAGQPSRHNPLTSSPYLEELQDLQQGGLYRSYSFDSNPQPNFAAPFELSSLDVVEALVPKHTAEFFTTYLDRTISPIWFAGNNSWDRVPGTALTEYQTNKRYFDLVGSKYMVTRGTEYAVVLYDTEQVDQQRVPVNLDVALETTFLAPSDQVSQIQVLMSTYGKSNPGTLTATLLNKAGQVLHQSTLEGTAVQNDTYQNFYPEVQVTPAEVLRFRLEFSPSAPGSVLAVWRYPNNPNLGFSMRVVDTPYPVVFSDEENRMYISENPDALPRVFLAPEAKLEPDWEKALTELQHIPDLSRTVLISQGTPISSDWPTEQATGEVSGFQLEPNTVEFTYTAHTPGILVLTDSYDAGWKAEVNGEPAEVLRVDGVFRGVRIESPGEYAVKFWYQPPHWRLSLVLAGIGLLGVMALSLASFFPRRVAK